MYVSTLEPWSFWLTGQQGKAPSSFYDPLAFAVQEAHKRGMELHAWFNPYRCEREIGKYAIDPNHLSVKHPDWILAFAKVALKLLDPGLPQVRQHVTNVVMDVVNRYDVDGVHFDDYFYPYPDNQKGFSGITTEDNATFAQYHRGFTNRGDWRRDNVNLLVKMIHDSIQVVKPYVKFGVSPFGVRRNSDAGTNALEAYSTIYCDAVAWLNAKTVDYLTPQVYWAFARAEAPYGKLVPWWASVMNGLHLYVGHGAYNMASTLTFPAGSWPASELTNQVRFNRQQLNVEGSIFFRAKTLTDNVKNFSDSLRTNLYRYPALFPEMPWKDFVPPNAPQNLRYARIAGTGSAALRWEAPSKAFDGDTAFRYVVYRFDHSIIQPIELENPAKIIATTDLTFNMPKTPPAASTPYYYVVTALDRISNESLPTSTILVLPPPAVLLAAPANGATAEITNLTLRWNYPNHAASYQLQVSSDSTFASMLLVNESGLVDTFKVISGLTAQTAYYWRVQASNAGGTGAFSTTWRFKTIETTAVAGKPTVPATFALYQNYPNPFNPITTIVFDLPKPGTAQLIIYDILGQEVLMLLDEPTPAGRHEAHFYAHDLPSGVYYYRLKFEGRILTKKMTILR
jgi:uncharacterized lipoprotein YddW (UPF0748 family)